MYTPNQLVLIDSKIRDLAQNHYRYGSSMPLCYGKARGISRILETFYNIEVDVRYVFDVVKEFVNEPKE